MIEIPWLLEIIRETNLIANNILRFHEIFKKKKKSCLRYFHEFCVKPSWLQVTLRARFHEIFCENNFKKGKKRFYMKPKYLQISALFEFTNFSVKPISEKNFSTNFHEFYREIKLKWSFKAWFHDFECFTNKVIAGNLLFVSVWSFYQHPLK